VTILSRLPRACAAGLLGAFAGAAWLVFTYAVSPAMTFKSDRDMPPGISGFYPSERDGDQTFVWTHPQAVVALPGLDRRTAWRCWAVLRGARPDPATLPEVRLAADGAESLQRATTNEYRTYEITIPAAPNKRGLRLSLTATPPFVPGTDDPRQLGVMVREIGCAPAAGGIALPPDHALWSAAFAAGILGAGIGLAGVTVGSAVGAAAALAAGQSLALAAGIAPFSAYPDRAVSLAFWISLALLAGLVAVEAVRRQPLRNTARFAAIFTAGALYLKLLVLLHPAKFIGDAMFHAHRFMTVAAGNFFFTSIAPGNYEFPYAVALYVAALPFRGLTADPVLLLRVVTTVADALAGILVYVIVARAWRDRLVAAMAVALFTFVPLAFDILGVGNLTNSFGNSLAIVAAALVTAPAFDLAAPWLIALASVAVAAAFLAHTSTFALLFTILVLAAVAYRLVGRPPLGRPAAAMLACVAIASVLSVGIYYRHFGPVYRAQYQRISREVTQPDAARAAGEGAAVQHGLGSRTPRERLSLVPGYLSAYIGWPMLALAALGLWRLARTGARDRLGLFVLAWLTACLLFLVLGIATPIDMRHYLAAIPAVAIVAAVGAGWGWARRGRVRWATAFLLLWVVWNATWNWIRWIH